MPQSGPPEKTPWDVVATLGNGFLAVLALVFMLWAGCASGEGYESPGLSHPATTTSVQQ